MPPLSLSANGPILRLSCHHSRRSRGFVFPPSPAPESLLSCTSVADDKPTPLPAHLSPAYPLSFTSTSSEERNPCTLVKRLAFNTGRGKHVRVLAIARAALQADYRQSCLPCRSLSWVYTLISCERKSADSRRRPIGACSTRAMSEFGFLI